jgi:hypothetical protein
VLSICLQYNPLNHCSARVLEAVKGGLEMSSPNEPANMIQKKNQLLHFKREYETLRKTLQDFPEQQKHQTKPSMVNA